MNNRSANSPTPWSVGFDRHYLPLPGQNGLGACVDLCHGASSILMTWLHVERPQLDQ